MHDGGGTLEVEALPTSRPSTAQSCRARQIPGVPSPARAGARFGPRPLRLPPHIRGLRGSLQPPLEVGERDEMAVEAKHDAMSSSRSTNSAASHARAHRKPGQQPVDALRRWRSLRRTRAGTLRDRQAKAVAPHQTTHAADRQSRRALSLPSTLPVASLLTRPSPKCARRQRCRAGVRRAPPARNAALTVHWWNAPPCASARRIRR